jgi:hypothetical protein
MNIGWIVPMLFYEKHKLYFVGFKLKFADSARAHQMWK